MVTREQAMSTTKQKKKGSTLSAILDKGANQVTKRIRQVLRDNMAAISAQIAGAMSGVLLPVVGAASAATTTALTIVNTLAASTALTAVAVVGVQQAIETQGVEAVTGLLEDLGLDDTGLLTSMIQEIALSVPQGVIVESIETLQQDIQDLTTLIVNSSEVGNDVGKVLEVVAQSNNVLLAQSAKMLLQEGSAPEALLDNAEALLNSGIFEAFDLDISKFSTSLINLSKDLGGTDSDVAGIPSFIKQDLTFINENQEYTLVTTWKDSDGSFKTQQVSIPAHNFEVTTSHTEFVSFVAANGMEVIEAINVYVVDVEEKPEIMSFSLNSIPENTQATLTVRIYDEEDGWVTQYYTLTNTDFETVQTITVPVTYTDAAGNVVSSNYTVAVENINEIPHISNITSTQVDENQPLEITVTWSDPEDGLVTQTYSIPPQDYETNTFYVLPVTYTDEGGLTEATSIPIVINNVNEHFQLISINLSSINENESGQLVVVWEDPEDGLVTQTYTIDPQDYETNQLLNIPLTITDSDGKTVTASTTLNVVDVNEAPEFVRASQYLIPENLESTINVVWRDPEDGLVTQTYVIPAQDYEMNSTHTFTVAYTDSQGTTSSEEITLQVTDVNEAPIYIEHDVVSVRENDPATLRVTWFDPEDGLVITTHAINPQDYETSTSLNIVVSYTDSHGVKVSRDIGLIVEDVNEPPTSFNFIPTFDFDTLTYTVVLNAIDPDSNETIQYYQDGVLLASNVVTYTSDQLANNPADTTLIAVDSAGNSLTLVISPPEMVNTPGNDAPAFLNTSISSVDENSDAIVVVINWFDPEQGVLTTTHTIPTQDYESSPTYTATVSVTDEEGATSEQEIQLTVLDINEIPVFQGAILNKPIIENEANSLQVTWLDPEDGLVTQTYLIPELDFETNAFYTTTVSYTDSGGVTSTRTLTYPVTDENEPSIFLSSSASSVVENQPLVITVTWDDPEDGLITQTYPLDPQDYESNESVVVDVEYTDTGGTTYTHSIPIMILDVNEDAVLLSQSLNLVQENEEYEMTVTWSDPEDGLITQTYTFGPYDYEENISATETVSYTDSAGKTIVSSVTVDVVDVNEEPKLMGVSHTGVIENQSTLVTAVWYDPEDGYTTQTYTVAPLDYETSPTTTLILTYTDKGGITVTETVPLGVTDVNEPSVFQSLSVDSVDENTSITFTATWLDPEDGLVTTSHIIPELDFEATSEYSFKITYTDTGGTTYTHPLTIPVNDLIENELVLDLDREVAIIELSDAADMDYFTPWGSVILHDADGEELDFDTRNETPPQFIPTEPQTEVSNGISFNVDIKHAATQINVSLITDLEKDFPTSGSSEDDLFITLYRIEQDGTWVSVATHKWDNISRDEKSRSTILEGDFSKGDYVVLLDLNEPGLDNTNWSIEDIRLEVLEWGPGSQIVGTDFDITRDAESTVSHQVDLLPDQAYTLTLDYVPSDSFEVRHNDKVLLTVDKEEGEAEPTTVSLVITGEEGLDTISIVGTGTDADNVEGRIDSMTLDLYDPTG